MIKAIPILIIAVLSLFVTQVKTAPDSYLHLIVCDVGQGDAILILNGSNQVLIDGGEKGEATLACLAEHLPWGDRTLEMVVATHPDADHIGGLGSVLERYQVNHLLVNGERKDSDVFRRFQSLYQSKEARPEVIYVPERGDRWWLGGGVWLENLTTRGEGCPREPLLATNPETTLQAVECAESGDEQSSNDRSLVLKLEFKEVSALLMGDLEEQGELALLAEGVLTPVTIVKLGHHGAKTSSSPRFVDATRPEIGLVSVGKNNRYGHPAPEVMTRYDAVGSQILRTDQLGTVELLSDGNRVWQKPTPATNSLAGLSHLFLNLSSAVLDQLGF